jgi:general secretion pathway protein K
MVVIVVLGLLAAGFAYSMKVETQLARNLTFESDMLWIARSGVELARYVLALQKTIPQEMGWDALNQKWAGGPGTTTNEVLTDISLVNNPLGPGVFSVEIRDLERTLNVNIANREMFERAMEFLGYDSLTSSTVIDSIEDWKDPNEATRVNGTESDFYLTLSTPYRAKDGYIDELGELLLVRGVTPEMFWGEKSPVGAVDRLVASIATPREMGRQLGLVDLFNTLGAAQVNINTAPVHVLHLLPGVDWDIAEGIVSLRAGPDQIDGTEDDTPFQRVGELINVRGMMPQFVSQLTTMCSVVSFTFEVRVRVRVAQYERVYVAHLLRRNARDVQILSGFWE